MAHLLKIMTGDGDGGVVTSLSTEGCLLQEYWPQSPPIRTVEALGNADGGEIPEAALANVTETCRVCFYDYDAYTAETIMRRVERAFRDAERFQSTGQGRRIYVWLQLDGEASPYHAEILTGRVDLDQESLAVDTANGQLRATLTWTRRYTWQRTTQVAVALSNYYGTNVSSGLRVLNHQDFGTGHTNVLYLGAGALEGPLATPAVLRLTNDTGSAVGWRNLYLGLMVWDQSTVASYPWHTLEGEEGGGGTADASCSGGQYKTFTLPATEAEIGNWTLTELNKCMGKHFHVLARFQTAPATNGRLRLGVKYPTGNVMVWSGTEVALQGTQLQDLGVVQLPPTLTGYAAYQNLVLTLRGRYAGGGTGPLKLDYLMLLPADSFRRLAILADVPAGGVIVDDGLTGEAYVEANGARAPTVNGLGQPLLLRPGWPLALYVLGDEGTNQVIDRTLSVQVVYRPRRLTV